MPYHLLLNGSPIREFDTLPARVDIDNIGSVHGISPGWSQDGYTFDAFERPPSPPAPLSSHHVNAERDRRLLVFKFGGKEFDFDAFSAMNIAGAGTLAFAAIINGAQPGNLRWADPNADFGWIARDNARVPMDAQTCFAFAQAAANWRAGHIYAARALKDAPGGIPADYAADARWPS